MKVIIFSYFSAIDEIVLSYIVGCLEELGSENAAEDAFDVDDFSEMMEAYLPGFTNIGRYGARKRCFIVVYLAIIC